MNDDIESVRSSCYGKIIIYSNKRKELIPLTDRSSTKEKDYYSEKFLKLLCYSLAEQLSNLRET